MEVYIEDIRTRVWEARRRWWSDVWQRSAFFQQARASRPLVSISHPSKRKHVARRIFFIQNHCFEKRTPLLGQVVLSPARNWWENKSESLEMFFDRTLFNHLPERVHPFIHTKPPSPTSEPNHSRKRTEAFKGFFHIDDEIKMAMDVVVGKGERTPRTCAPPSPKSLPLHSFESSFTGMVGSGSRAPSCRSISKYLLKNSSL